MMTGRIIFWVAIMTLIQGCATVPVSQQVFGVEFPLVTVKEYPSEATITFSAEKKYESENGVPLEGEPLVCQDGAIHTGVYVEENIKKTVNPIRVPAGEKAVLSSIISWVNTGIEKTCWPFVSFTPEPGIEYVVVNERIGGKGISALWTGVAFQKCEVSVFRVNEDGFERIAVSPAKVSECKK